MRALAFVLVFGVACASDPPTYESDLHQVVFSEESGILDVAASPAPYAVLQGTTMHLSPTCPLGSPCANVAHGASLCFDYSLSTPNFHSLVATFDTPGPVTLNLEPKACGLAASAPQPSPDAVRFDVVAPEDVEGVTPMLPESYTEGPYVYVDAPEGWLREDSAPWRLVSGQAFELTASLRKRGSGTILAHPAGTWRLDGASEVQPSGDTSMSATVFARGSGRQTLSYQTVAGSFPVASLDVVAHPTVARMELAVGWSAGGADPTRSGGSFFVRAVLWDEEGNLIFGAPVHWSADRMVAVAGPQPAVLAPWLPGADYLYLKDLCRDPSAEHGAATATVRASYGGQHAAKRLRWIVPEPEEGAEPWVASPLCSNRLGGSANTGEGSPLFGIGVLGWLGWSGWRRRAPTRGSPGATTRSSRTSATIP